MALNYEGARRWTMVREIITVAFIGKCKEGEDRRRGKGRDSQIMTPEVGN